MGKNKTQMSRGHTPHIPTSFVSWSARGGMQILFYKVAVTNAKLFSSSQKSRDLFVLPRSSAQQRLAAIGDFLRLRPSVLQVVMLSAGRELMLWLGYATFLTLSCLVSMVLCAGKTKKHTASASPPPTEPKIVTSKEGQTVSTVFSGAMFSCPFQDTTEPKKSSDTKPEESNKEKKKEQKPMSKPNPKPAKKQRSEEKAESSNYQDVSVD